MWNGLKSLYRDQSLTFFGRAAHIPLSCCGFTVCEVQTEGGKREQSSL